jgi:ferric-dicitrate binding protein FerR (iron transport regulator)
LEVDLFFSFSITSFFQSCCLPSRQPTVMPTTRLAYLFQRYFEKTATNAETAELMRLLALKENEAEVQALMEQAWETFGTGSASFIEGSSTDGPFTPDQTEEMLRHSLEAKQAIPVRRMTRVRTAAAAAVLFALGTGAWWLDHARTSVGPAHVSHPVASLKKGDIAPGGDKAVLTLGDGSVITLDSVQKGTLATQGHTQVLQVGGGQLAYRVGAGSPATSGIAPSFNTITTPRGGQYRVTLADGTRVWLNSFSSLHFPTAFTGTDREVELTGEAYFEVAENRHQPFRVKVNNMQVDVLGTHFDVMAYEDEASMNTSLLQGSVRVVRGPQSGLLRPGEEASLNRISGDLRVAVADTDQAVAWKNGLFQFDGATIEQVMRQLARWYDIQVTYQGNIPTHYSGGFSRKATLSEVLDMLQLGVRARFVMEGKNVTVRPL